MWKARRKYRLAFFLLPTQLRDKVPTFRHAFNLFAWAIRRLLGQAHSYDEAKEMNVLPGSVTLDPSILDDVQRDLTTGLALMEGSLPLSHLNPALHHFVHYVEYAMTHGIPVWYWMMGFERNNKHMKGLVKNPHYPDMSLAKATLLDVSARFVNVRDNNEDLRGQRLPRQPHQCRLHGRSRAYFPTSAEIADLRLRGARVLDILAVTEYPMASILNIHFKAGEWECRPRCGSVITCVMRGRSLYARVNKFLSVLGDDSPGYASVSWFSPPEYPTETPLVVRVTDAGATLDADYGCIIPITQIEPSRVMVEIATDKYFMMRDTGYDRVVE